MGDDRQWAAIWRTEDYPPVTRTTWRQNGEVDSVEETSRYGVLSSLGSPGCRLTSDGRTVRLEWELTPNNDPNAAVRIALSFNSNR